MPEVVLFPNKQDTVFPFIVYFRKCQVFRDSSNRVNQENTRILHPSFHNHGGSKMFCFRDFDLHNRLYWVEYMDSVPIGAPDNWSQASRKESRCSSTGLDRLRVDTGSGPVIQGVGPTMGGHREWDRLRVDTGSGTDYGWTQGAGPTTGGKGSGTDCGWTQRTGPNQKHHEWVVTHLRGPRTVTVVDSPRTLPTFVPVLSS